MLGFRVGATGAVHLNPAKSTVVALAPVDSVLVVESRAEVAVPAR